MVKKDKVWFEGKWSYDLACGEWKHLKPGYYDVGAAPSSDDFDHIIRSTDIRSLITALDKYGWIKPRLDERLREEDLKITHRLLDIVSAQVGAR